jgi:hypothetical protein
MVRRRAHPERGVCLVSELPPGWTRLPEEHLPRPCFWSAGLALAITFMLWGLITSWVIECIGLVLAVRSLFGWINAIRLERRQQK